MCRQTHNVQSGKSLPGRPSTTLEIFKYLRIRPRLVAANAMSESLAQYRCLPLGAASHLHYPIQFGTKSGVCCMPALPRTQGVEKMTTLTAPCDLAQDQFEYHQVRRNPLQPPSSRCGSFAPRNICQLPLCLERDTYGPTSLSY